MAQRFFLYRQALTRRRLVIFSIYRDSQASTVSLNTRTRTKDARFFSLARVKLKPVVNCNNVPIANCDICRVAIYAGSFSTVRIGQSDRLVCRRMSYFEGLVPQWILQKDTFWRNSTDLCIIIPFGNWPAVWPPNADKWKVRLVREKHRLLSRRLTAGFLIRSKYKIKRCSNVTQLKVMFTKVKWRSPKVSCWRYANNSPTIFFCTFN